MAEWVKAAALADLEPGEMLGVAVGDTPVALFNVGGRVYATSDVCTHAYAHLTDGYFDEEDCVVECPLHNGRFAIDTGAAIDGPVVEPVATYPVKIEDGFILIEIG